MRSGLMRRLTAMGGSDVAEASEMENGNEEAGETNRGWEKVKSRKEKKRRRRASSGNSSNGKSLESGEENTRVSVRQQEEIKVKLQFDSPCSLNPLKLSKALHDAVGTVSVKPLRNGSLIITCVDNRQRDLLVKMTTLEGKNIKCGLWEKKRIVLGVITGVPTELTNDEIEKCDGS